MDQLAREEATSRADRAATLIGELGNADDTTRWWRASALSMYPDEALPVLVSALGHAEPKTLTALATALLSIGAPSIEPLARANRIAAPTNPTWQQANYDERSSRLLDALNTALSPSAGS